jgi:hypothetical protein
MWLDHDAKRKLLQMRELWQHERLQLRLGLDDTKARGRIRALRQVNLGGGGLGCMNPPLFIGDSMMLPLRQRTYYGFDDSRGGVSEISRKIRSASR